MRSCGRRQPRRLAPRAVDTVVLGHWYSSDRGSHDEGRGIMRVVDTHGLLKDMYHELAILTISTLCSPHILRPQAPNRPEPHPRKALSAGNLWEWGMRSLASCLRARRSQGNLGSSYFRG